MSGCFAATTAELSGCDRYLAHKPKIFTLSLFPEKPAWFTAVSQTLDENYLGVFVKYNQSLAPRQT